MKNILIIFLLTCSTSCLSSPSKSVSNTSNDYEIQKDSVWIETSNGLIFGLVFKPKGLDVKKLPAVLCLQGGGDVGLDNYLYEAQYFAKIGMIALVCDKSGTGLSKTKKSWRGQSFKDKTKEYYELLAWLANRSEVDSKKLGIHGMSEGGRLALFVAAEYPDKVAFVNSVSGPIESYKKNQLYAIKHYLANRNIDKDVINQALDVWDTYYNEVAVRKISPETVAKVNELRARHPNLQYLPSNTTALPARPLPEDIHYTLENKLDQVKCPVLFQFGELDILVDPKKSFSLIPENSKFEIKNYLDTDHSMNLKNGDVHPNFLSDKKEWLLRVLDL